MYILLGRGEGEQVGAFDWVLDSFLDRGVFVFYEICAKVRVARGLACIYSVAV